MQFLKMDIIHLIHTQQPIFKIKEKDTMRQHSSLGNCILSKFELKDHDLKKETLQCLFVKKKCDLI